MKAINTLPTQVIAFVLTAIFLTALFACMIKSFGFISF